VLEECIIEIFTSQVGVASRGLDGEDTPADIKKGNIESSTTQIEDKDILLSLALTIKTVCNGSSRRLVYDTQDFKTGDGTSILGSKTLGIVEVSRDPVNKNLSEVYGEKE
jgi:hypothetical protein